METAMTRIVLTAARAFFRVATASFVSFLEPDMFRMAPTHKL
jgi:hypothetical protein